MKQIRIKFSDGAIYHVSANVVADDRAVYYAGVDARDIENEEERQQVTRESYKTEYDIALEDEDVLLDWVNNNMDWKEVQHHAVYQYVEGGTDYNDEFSNAEKFVIGE